MKFYTYERGGGGRGTQSFGVVFAWKLVKVLAILKGGWGYKKFTLFKREA